MSSPSFERTPPEAQELLARPIRDLGLKIEGSPVEPAIHRLYAELQTAGLRHFRPACYLTDQWGCPSEEPVIGIPFYLADRRLGTIEGALNDLETEAEVMMYLRHEAGHAFNYAYRLYERDDWRKLFGPFRRAYRDHYTPVPFSRKYVRHISGWYAQKHPDEDFAESFAVWLTPDLDWRDRYAGWPALKKVEWVEAVAREVADLPPLKPLGEIDFTVDDMVATVQQFYLDNHADERRHVESLPLTSDLRDIFSDVEGIAAAEVIGRHRKVMTDKISYWTGVRRTLIKEIVEAAEGKVAGLELKVRTDLEAERIAELTAYITTLAMNYLTRGRLTH